MSSITPIFRPQPSGLPTIVLQAFISSQAQRKCELMGEDYVRLSFHQPKAIALNAGDYIVLDGQAFHLTQPVAPTYEPATAAYLYNLSFHAAHKLWDNHLMRLCLDTPQGIERTDTRWTLTAPLHEHLDQLLLNLQAIGLLHHSGKPYTHRIHSSHLLTIPPTSAVCVSYDGTTLLQALNQLCSEKAYNCEWWMDGSTLHIGFLGADATPIATIEQGRDGHYTSTDSRESKPTRYYVQGGGTNLPPTYGRILRFEASKQWLAQGVIFDPVRPIQPQWLDAYEREEQHASLSHLFTTEQLDIFTTNGVKVGHNDNPNSPSYDPTLPSEQNEDLTRPDIILARNDQAIFTFLANTHYILDATDLRLLSSKYPQGVQGQAACLSLYWGALPSEKKDVLEVSGLRLKRIARLGNDGVFAAKEEFMYGTATTRKGLYVLSTYSLYDSSVGTDGLRIEGDVTLSIAEPELLMRPRLTFEGIGQAIEVRLPNPFTEPQLPTLAFIPTSDQVRQQLASLQESTRTFMPLGVDQTRLPLSYYTPINQAEGGNGVAPTTLQLPRATHPNGYIDFSPNSPSGARVERVLSLPHIFPRVDMKVGNVEVKQDGKGHPLFTITDSVGTLPINQSILLEGEPLKVKFESGKLGGMEFQAQIDETSINITPNENYGALLPSAVLRPEVSDKFILLGFNTLALGSSALVEAAETKLLTAAQEIITREELMSKSYELTLLPQLNKAGQVLPPLSLGLGQMLTLKEEATETAPLRIVGYERSIDCPEDAPRYRLAARRKPSALQLARAAASQNGSSTIIVKESGAYSNQVIHQSSKTENSAIIAGMKAEVDKAAADLREVKDGAWRDGVITEAEEIAIARAHLQQLTAESSYLIARADAVLAAHQNLQEQYGDEYSAISSHHTQNKRWWYIYVQKWMVAALQGFIVQDATYTYEGRQVAVPSRYEDLFKVGMGFGGHLLGDYYIEVRNDFEAAIVKADRAKDGKDGRDGQDAHSPRISENGTWLVWDVNAQSYIDTYDPARGESGENGLSPRISDDGYWEVYEGGGWSKTSTKAQGEKGEKGEPGADGAAGKDGARGANGRDGSDGADGRGIISITPLYKLHASSTAAPAAPSSYALNGWSEGKPFYMAGRYLWRCEQQRYSDGTIAFTTPMLESEWVALQQMQIGGQNYFGWGKGISANYYNRPPTSDGTNKTFSVKCRYLTRPLPKVGSGGKLDGFRLEVEELHSDQYNSGSYYDSYRQSCILLRLQNLKLPEAGQYVVSFQVRASKRLAAKHWVGGSVQGERSVLNVNLCDELVGYFIPTTEWQRVEVSGRASLYLGYPYYGFLDIELDAGVRQRSWQSEVNEGGWLEIGDWIEIKELQIERGTKATAYKPSLDYLTQLLHQPTGMEDGVVFGGRIDAQQDGVTNAFLNGVNLDQVPVLAAGHVAWDNGRASADIELWADGRMKLGDKFSWNGSELNLKGRMTLEEIGLQLIPQPSYSGVYNPAPLNGSLLTFGGAVLFPSLPESGAREVRIILSAGMALHPVVKESGVRVRLSQSVNGDRASHRIATALGWREGGMTYWYITSTSIVGDVVLDSNNSTSYVPSLNEQP